MRTLGIRHLGGGVPKSHLVRLVLLRCRIGLTPQSASTRLPSSESELRVLRSVIRIFFDGTRCVFGVPPSRCGYQKRSVRAAPRHPANTSRRQIEICQRSPFLKSSNAKSWGPAGLPVGSDLVIDERTRKTLPTGGCDHAVSATTW